MNDKPKEIIKSEEIFQKQVQVWIDFVQNNKVTGIRALRADECDPDLGPSVTFYFETEV